MVPAILLLDLITFLSCSISGFHHGAQEVGGLDHGIHYSTAPFMLVSRAATASIVVAWDHGVGGVAMAWKCW